LEAQDEFVEQDGRSQAALWYHTLSFLELLLLVFVALVEEDPQVLEERSEILM
jgi:hypothetical protein